MFVSTTYSNHYFTYGKLLRSFVGGNGQERYLTTQHERDEESISENNFGTGLDYRINRIYDSDIARFTTVDKLADVPEQISMSPYQYVWGRPTMLTDPDGNCPECKDWLISMQIKLHNWWNAPPEPNRKGGGGFNLVTNNDLVPGNKPELKSKTNEGTENINLDEFGSLNRALPPGPGAFKEGLETGFTILEMLFDMFGDPTVKDLQQGDSAKMKGKTNMGFSIEVPIIRDTNSESGVKLLNISSDDKSMDDKPTVTP